MITNEPKTSSHVFRKAVHQRLQKLSLEEICAEIYQHKNWHNLTFEEEVIVSRLEKSGHLRPSSQGFVGGLNSTTTPQ